MLNAALRGDAIEAQVPVFGVHRGDDLAIEGEADHVGAAPRFALNAKSQRPILVAAAHP